MPSVHIDNVGEMAIIECAGRFVRTETAFKLRDAVTSQTDGCSPQPSHYQSSS